MTRDPNDKVPLTLRLPERLRQQLEYRAKKNQRSLNSEVISELNSYNEQVSLIAVRFGSDEIAAIMQAFSSCFVLAQIQTGKAFSGDPITMQRALVAMRVILESFVANVEVFKEQDPEPIENTIQSGLEIARYAGPTFFSGQPIEEPEWLRSFVERSRNKNEQPASTEDDSSQ